MCHTNLWSFPVPYSMPISKFLIPSSKNRFALAALFSPFYRIYHRWPCVIMAQFGEKLQNQIEPIIRDFIDCMEPGTPRVEIESHCREDSCQVFIRFKKSRSEKHSLFKTGFKISSESDVRYLRWFLNDIFLQWRFWHPSQEEDYRLLFRQFIIYSGLDFLYNQHTTSFHEYIHEIFTFIYITLHTNNT